MKEANDEKEKKSKDTKVDELSEEELRRLLAENEQQNQKADIDEGAEEIEENDSLEVVDEITILPPKEKRKKDKQESKEERRVEKLRQQSLGNLHLY